MSPLFPYIYNMNKSIFRYRNLDRQLFKKNKGYNGYVNDHHVIPKEHRNHRILQIIDFDIHSNFNLFIMPTKKHLLSLIYTQTL